MPQNINKREQDLDMMPPPESSLVPLASRRSTLNLPCNAHSPPVHMLKQEYVDENSQSSMQEHERYRHISESSLDVHHGDSNMSMVNDNSVDLMHQMSQMSENSNISVGKEDPPNDVEIISRRSKLSSCENTNSNISNINEDSSSQPSILPRLLNNDKEKVMDLTMKMPTVSDLASTSAPTMATLQRFGISENLTEPLPSQSAQSVESYLNKIEAKPSIIPMTNPPGMLLKNDLSEKLTQIISASEAGVYQVHKPQHCSMVTNTTPSLSYLAPNVASREAVYLSSNKNYMSNTSQQSQTANIVAKSEGADVAERTISEQTITTMATSMERSVPTPINTERLDDLINSTVESHLSPTRTDTALKDDLVIASQDVMLNTQNNLMVPPAISTRLSSPVDIQHNHTTNLSSEAILNSQVSPTMLCRTNETLLPTMCQPSVETSLLPAPPQNLLVPSGIPASNAPLAVNLVSEPEKAVLLKAAVDLLETQKKISELGTTKSQDIGSIASPSATALSHEGTFVQPQPFPVTEIQPAHPAVNDKKHEDRMIPHSFTSLTENELINLINPSCFDQGNNIHDYH
nr:unnamed protein product [Callosobruchus chinensis]